MMSCAISTFPCAFSNAGQAFTGTLPSAMFTPVISSEMFTTPDRSQSPTQAAWGVVGVLVAVASLVGEAARVVVAVAVLVKLGSAVSVLVGATVVVDVPVLVGDVEGSVGVGVGVRTVTTQAPFTRTSPFVQLAQSVDVGPLHVAQLTWHAPV